MYIFFETGEAWYVDSKKIKCYENQKIFPFFIKSLHREQRFLIFFFSPDKYIFPQKNIR